ncbi:uncharacterized protein AB675_11191 [Cyphellophora attinorum]|uniref:Dienelactone hydrolase domain-containing protein n=1 Tax=Cyphellophora attinorum TaxID=1664694 RepID=A0A0N0NHR0_9EURO|nr:uncharacterized protein AB675_11191 [Phialophora attinorum]KPI34559.1 hypothetical protein AB675_11191 [Phialophora attinorum]
MSFSVQTRACCTRPPVVLRGGYDYKEKGEYIDFNGMKTYVTGNPSATRGIFLCYDVFGLFVQAIKGCDILAYGSDETPDNAGDFKVFMPDFWGDHPQDLNNFPPKTPKQRQAVYDFMTGPANPKTVLPLMQPLHDAFQKHSPKINSWSLVGFCWGVKMLALVTTKGTKFQAAAGCHPSLMDVEDAKKVSVPFCIMPSQDEDPELVDAWFHEIKARNPNSYLETFGDQVHGWMTSRADFNNLHNYEEYLRGYRIMRTFLAAHA